LVCRRRLVGVSRRPPGRATIPAEAMAGIQPCPTADAVPDFAGRHNARSDYRRKQPQNCWGLTRSTYSARLPAGTLHVVALHRSRCSYSVTGRPVRPTSPSRRSNVPLRVCLWPTVAGSKPVNSPRGQEDAAPRGKSCASGGRPLGDRSGAEASGTRRTKPGAGGRRRPGVHSLGGDVTGPRRSSQAPQRAWSRGAGRAGNR